MILLFSNASIIVPVDIAFLFASIYRCLIYPTFVSPLSKIPSIHPVAAITSLWMLWIRFCNVENDTVFQAHKKHGPVVRLGPNEISVNCVDDGIKTVYGKGFEKTSYYASFANFNVSNMFSSLESGPHAIKKKRIANIYSKSHLQNSPDMAAITAALLKDRLLPLLSQYAETGEAFDIMPIVQASAMDSATAYFFGFENATNFLLDESSRLHWLELYLRSRQRDYMFYLQELPMLTRWLANIGFHLVPQSREKYIHMVDAWCLNMCDGAEQTLSCGRTTEIVPGNNPVVYRQLKTTTSKEGLASDATVSLNSFRFEGSTGPAAVPDPRNIRSPQQLEVASELLDQLIAAHETFPITLTYIFWELSRHPEMQQRLRCEILSIGQYFLFPQVSQNCIGKLPDAKSIDERPVLHAIVIETLRLHPALGGGQPRHTPPEGHIKLGKHSDIPGGVRVSAYACNLHKNPDVFPDPFGWHPERWMPGEESRPWQGIDKKERWFWAFGSGGRMCVGSNFAMQMMKYIVAATYANFETRIVDDEGIEQADGFIAGPKSDKLVLSILPAHRSSSDSMTR